MNNYAEQYTLAHTRRINSVLVGQHPVLLGNGDTVFLKRVHLIAASDKLRHSIEDKKQILLQLNAKHVWLNGDATRLRQIVHNLLHNAHDALQQVINPQIMVVTKSSATEFHLEVSDNGCGIPDHILARIFSIRGVLHEAF